MNPEVQRMIEALQQAYISKLQNGPPVDRTGYENLPSKPPERSYEESKGTGPLIQMRLDEIRGPLHDAQLRGSADADNPGRYDDFNNIISELRMGRNGGAQEMLLKAMLMMNKPQEGPGL